LTSQEEETESIDQRQSRRLNELNKDNNSDVPSVWFPWVSSPEEIKTMVMEEMQKVQPVKALAASKLHHSECVTINQVPIEIKELVEPLFQDR